MEIVNITNHSLFLFIQFCRTRYHTQGYGSECKKKIKCLRAKTAGQIPSAWLLQITAFGVIVIKGLFSIYAGVLETGISPTEITLYADVTAHRDP